MSFPRYPAYKDSGVEWLGEVPQHWQTLRLRSLCGEPIRNGIGEASDQDDPLNPRYVRITDIADSRSLREDTFKSLPSNLAAAAELRVNDILFAAVGATYGKSYFHCRDIGPACFAGYLVKFTPAESVAGGYIAYWTESSHYWAQVDSRVIQSTVQNFSASKFRELTVPVPSLTEQKAIEAFLDHETAKIDALVAEQERLIELLKEKRQAVISHAVTKGLDPSVPMKDSGVEWLGEVPAHWRVMPIRLAARLESGHTPSRSRPDWWTDCTIPWFTLGDVWQIRDGGVDVVYETKELVSELGLANSSARLLPKGTVILSRTASVGFSAVMGVDMATTQDFANWVCGAELNPEFLLSVFRSMKGEFQRLMMGSTHNTIYMPDIQAFRFALPPLSEQLAIVAHVKGEALVFDNLISEADVAVQLLRERRTALISAAVTGQIDVRQLTQ